MPSPQLVTTARCHACDWVPEGDPDKAAEKHTKATGHPTAVMTRVTG